MPGLFFEDQAPASVSHPNRTDIALFAGLVRARPGARLPDSKLRWLTESGWTSKPYLRALDGLLNLPVPIDNWPQFDRLFLWEQRIAAGNDGSTYLGAAVRSFFAQGGRKCYVVRAGDPLGLEAPAQERRQAIGALIPGYPETFEASGADRFSWLGAAHIFGLPDVSFLCLPDLADLTGMDRRRVEVSPPPPGPAEEFTECSVDLPQPPKDRAIRDISAPRCDADGYAAWASAVNMMANVLLRSVREVHLVAALPLPDRDFTLDAIAPTAFLQLAYPWVRTPGSAALPEMLESPDGALTGILARNALTRGTYRSAAGLSVPDISDLSPKLSREQMSANRLSERVSLIGPTPSGLRLISDVTMFGGETYRPASVSRLMAVIVRTARSIGESITFEGSGERVWGQVRDGLNNLLRGLFEAGALRGASPSESYEVRCDRSTMSQNDMDNGRVIARIQFDAAAPIDTITVALVINEGREMAVLASEAA